MRRLLAAAIGAWFALFCGPAMGLSSPDPEEAVYFTTPTLHWHVDESDDLAAPAASVYAPGADPNTDNPVDTEVVSADPGDYSWVPNLHDGRYGRYTFVVDDDNGGVAPVVRHFTLAPVLDVVVHTGDTGSTFVDVLSGAITAVTAQLDRRVPRHVTLEPDVNSPKLLVQTVVLPWDCHAGRHTLTVTGTGPTGEPETRTGTFTTPSCKGRFVAIAPRAVRSGAVATLRARDDWQEVVHYRLCWGRRGGHARCARHKTDDTGHSRVRLRAGRPGNYTASWRFPGGRSAHTTVVVRPRK